MKKPISLLACACLLATTGCGAALKDLRHPGGYPGDVLDRHSFNASGSKQLILLRAAIVLAMAAQIGKETVRGEDADAFARYLAVTADEINFAAADIYPGADGRAPCSASAANTAAATTCPGYYANFESGLPRIEQRLVKLTVAALPSDKARKFLDATAGGNVIGAAWNALSGFGKLAQGFHLASGTFRSGTEIVAANACGTAFAEATDTVADAVSCLELPTNSLFTPTDGPLPGDGTVSPSAFDALMRIANASCTALPHLETGADAATLAAARANRRADCSRLWFAPTERPVTPRD